MTDTLPLYYRMRIAEVLLNTAKMVVKNYRSDNKLSQTYANPDLNQRRTLQLTQGLGLILTSIYTDTTMQPMTASPRIWNF